MKQFNSSDLKTILHSKRANLFYLEHCRVMQKDGRVLYLTDTQEEKQYFNIPIANTTVILLGTGTSITQAAVRMLCQAGVLLGFCGGGGTPLYMGCDIEWMSPQNEYRPTQYLQAWLSFWFDQERRLLVAKQLQKNRIKYLIEVWGKDRDLQEKGFDANCAKVQSIVSGVEQQIESKNSVIDLLTLEARLTKDLYKLAAQNNHIANFSREHDSSDYANRFLNHGNYLAYGLAATTLWVLGIPHGFAVLHGKTRRGALVFDIADLIKDAIVLPLAFICASEGTTEQEFRACCLQKFTEHKALDFMFQQVKELAMENTLEGTFQ